MRQKITLIEKDKILGNNKEISEIFNNFFSSIVAKLNILKYEDLSVSSVNSKDPLENLVVKCKNQPSVRAILDKSLNTSFSLKIVSKKYVEKEILNLNAAKASQDSYIPAKAFKKNLDVFSDILLKEFNISWEICKFPSCLKMANVTTVYRKGNRSDKNNYRPVSILPNLSKVFERCLGKQIFTFFEDILCKYQNIAPNSAY